MPYKFLKITKPKPNMKSKKYKYPQIWGFKSEIEMFQYIWENTPHVSYISGAPLDGYYGTHLFLNLFAHVLSKALNKFPDYALNPGNIKLLTPDEHYALDHGSSDTRARMPECDWDKLFALKDELKQQYLNDKKNGII